MTLSPMDMAIKIACIFEVNLPFTRMTTRLIKFGENVTTCRPWTRGLLKSLRERKSYESNRRKVAILQQS